MKERKNVTILVVDDEEELARVLVTDFKRKGVQTLYASNGKDALALVKTHSIDVVVSDIKMPGGNGDVLLDRIKALNAESPSVILITGYADLPAVAAFDRGAEAVLYKPFDLQTLHAAVERVLLSKEARWATRSERFPVPVRVEFSDLKLALQTHALNIGRGGMFVALNSHLPIVNAQVAFTLTFNESPVFTISGNGIVRWARALAEGDAPSGCGIEFLYLPDEARQRVDRIVELSRTKSFIPKY